MAANETNASVLLSTDGAVATVTLNRPEAMNALDIATKELLLQHLSAVAVDPQVRAVVLTGAGRAFCVGQDLRQHIGLLHDADARLWKTVPEHYNPILTLLATMPKPVIAAVNGVAAGAGASFAFATDLRFVADSAGFNLAFTGVALSCDSGSSWTLPRLIGTGRAMDLLLRPRTVGAQEALALGLATEVVPAAELASVVAQVARTLAAGPTLAYAAIRQAVAHSATATLPDALAFEATLMDRTGASADHHEAVRAFLAKSSAQFTGQ